MRFSRLIPIAVIVMLPLTACGDTSGPVARSTPTLETQATTAAVVSGTRGEAQTVLETATAQIFESGSGHYELVAALTIGGDSTQITVTGDAMLREFRTDQTMRVPTEEDAALFRTVQLGADAYTLVTVDGRPQPCWFHVSRGTGPEARGSAITPPLLMLLDPIAQGRLEGGTQDEYLMKVLLDEATGAIFPKLANKLDGRIPTEAWVPARARLAAGTWRSISYEVADVLAGLSDAKVELYSEDLGGLELSDDVAGTVTIEYSEFGQDYSIEAPPANQVSSFDGVTSEEDFVPCVAAG